MKYSIEGIKAGLQKEDYIFFWGHQPSKDGKITKSCFSQWWLCEFIESTVSYKTAEHYMMAKKASLFGDKEIENEIIKCKSPKEVKALGRRVKGFSEDVWNNRKYEIVKEANYFKFSQNPALKDFILSTKDKTIVEASPNDRIWGIGMAQDHKDILNPKKWRGQNLLGFALMEIRDTL